MSECDLLVMEQQLTANIRSPTFSFPQRSAGLPSMMRPILWGMATQAFPAFALTYMFVVLWMLEIVCGDDLIVLIGFIDLDFMIRKKKLRKARKETQRKR